MEQLTAYLALSKNDRGPFVTYNPPEDEQQNVEDFLQNEDGEERSASMLVIDNKKLMLKIYN